MKLSLCAHLCLSCQTSAFSKTDVTPAAVSQQIAAMSSLLTDNPDEVSESAKISATNFLNQLAENLSPSDKESSSRLLASLGSTSQSSLNRRLSTVARRRLLHAVVRG